PLRGLTTKTKRTLLILNSLSDHWLTVRGSEPLKNFRPYLSLSLSNFTLLYFILPSTYIPRLASRNYAHLTYFTHSSLNQVRSRQRNTAPHLSWLISNKACFTATLATTANRPKRRRENLH
ncbi:hypothetical protein LZ31DRAFT_489674, partial [Colletotrichum somersetense]